MVLLGKYSYACNPKILWKVDDSDVTCGKFVSIAENVTMFLGNGIGHDSNFVTTYPFGEIHENIFPNVKNNSKNTNGSIIIGNDVWIGYGSTIMSGITIGDGAIIAANSHVVKSVEPYSIVGGNPAKHIKHRFSSEQIKNLLEIKWWDWSDYRINKYMKLMLSYDVDEFIKTVLSDDTHYFLDDEIDSSLICEMAFSSTYEYNSDLIIDVTDDPVIYYVDNSILVDEIDLSLNEVVENSEVIDPSLNEVVDNSEVIYPSLNEVVDNSEVIDPSLNEVVENSEVIDSSFNDVVENSELENDDNLFTDKNYSDRSSINETVQDAEIMEDIKELIDDIIIYIES